MSLLSIVIGVVAGILAGIAGVFVARAAIDRRGKRSLGMALYLVKIPRTSGNDKTGSAEGGDFKTELAHFEQLLGGLASSKAPVVFELAVPHVGEEICFYLSVPKSAGEMATKQVQGLWNGASVEPAPDDYNIFNSNGAVAAVYLKLKEHFSLPVKTYVEIGIDSFESIAGGFAKIQ